MTHWLKKICEIPQEMFPAQFCPGPWAEPRSEIQLILLVHPHFLFSSSPLQFLLTIWHRSHALQASTDYGVRWAGNSCDAYHPDKWLSCQAGERENLCPFRSLLLITNIYFPLFLVKCKMDITKRTANGGRKIRRFYCHGCRCYMLDTRVNKAACHLSKSFQ